MKAELWTPEGEKLCTINNVNGRAVSDSPKMTKALGLDKLYVQHPEHGAVTPKDGDKFIEALPHVFRGGAAIGAKVSK